jgi:hypothetical protein
MLKKVTIPPDIRALIVRELADALVLDYEEDTRIMVESPRGINHKTRLQNDKIVV